MPHPIYGPPSHRLERLDIALRLPRRANDFVSSINAIGYASTRRGSLWSVSESWAPDQTEHGLEPADMLHHLALVAIQDHPDTQARLELALRGGLDPSTQPELF